MWKEWLNKYNSFNSLKVLAHREKLNALARGEIITPVTVSIDPTNLCDVNCSWCINLDFRKSRATSIPDEVLLALPKFLKDWGVAAVVLDGGEPLMHPKIAEFLRGLKECNLQVGLKTNGVRLSQESIREAVKNTCHWVGISLDAGSPATYLKIKKALVGSFQKILDGVSWLVKNREDTRPRICMKFLIHHKNYGEMYQFSDLAKTIGADEVQFRPAYVINYKFNPGLRKTAEWHLRESRKALEDDSFHVYGIVHKFERDWVRAIRFKKCLATPLSGVFAADQIFYLCGDRRGDEVLNLGKFYPFEKFLEKWGSEDHKDKISRISPRACPRCSQCITNEIIERVVLEDEMALNFVCGQ